MPTYLYACECGDSIEINHSIKDDPVIECAVCGEAMSRRVAEVSVKFRGSGFYSTEKKTK